MFRLMKGDEPIEWPVTVHIPQDGGKTAKADFTARFVMLSPERLEEFALSKDRAFIAEVLVGWEGVADEDGNPLLFSEDARAKLAGIPYVVRAISAAYVQFASGVALKN